MRFILTDRQPESFKKWIFLWSLMKESHEIYMLLGFHKRSSDLMSNLNKMTVSDLHTQCWTINPNPVHFTVFTQVPLGVWDGALGHAPSVPSNCLGFFSPLGPFMNFHSSGSSMEWMFVTPPKFTCWNLIPTVMVTEGGAVWRMIRLVGWSEVKVTPLCPTLGNLGL